MPIHWIRIQNSTWGIEVELLAMASPTETSTTHNKMMAKDLATLSRRLKDSAYNNSEKAVIAIPAVNNSLMPLKPLITVSIMIFQHCRLRLYLYYPLSEENCNISIGKIMIDVAAEIKTQAQRQIYSREIFRLHPQH